MVRRLKKVLVILRAAARAIAAILFLAYPPRLRWVMVNKYNVRLPDFPAALGALAVAQLSDPHRSFYVRDRDIRHWVRISNRLAPDLFVLTGDFVTINAKCAAPCARDLAGLKSKYGSFAILGSHDYWAGADVVKKELERAGVRVLVNENLRIADKVWLVGIDDFFAGSPDIPKAFAGVPADAAAIVITHSPDIFPQIHRPGCLVLAGHCHGGPVLQLNPRSINIKYVAGWYEENDSRMYVNSGLGMFLPFKIVAPFRLRPRSEIALFKITR